MNSFLRSALAVVAGYLVFGISGAALFLLSGRDPHAAASIGLILFTTVYGMFFAALGGFTATAIAKSNRLVPAGLVGLLILIVAGISILTRPSGEPLWSQGVTLFCMAPAAILGGWLRVRNASKSVT